MMRKSIFVASSVISIFLVSSLCMFLNGNVYAQTDVIKWKCQAHLPMASTSYKGSVVDVTNRIKDRTNGRLIIEPYASGALVPAQEIFPAVKRGMFECGYSTPGYWQSDMPLGQISSGLPMAFANLWEILYFHKTLGFEKMLHESIAKHGVLFFSDHVEPNEIVLKKSLSKIEDLKGRKIRSFGLQAKLLNALGARATFIPGSEIYTALSTGVVDGAHWGAAQGADSMALYEICKYHMKPSLVLTCQDGWFINRDAFNKLPPDIQKSVLSVLEEQLYKRSVEYIAEEAKTLARVQKTRNVVVVTLSDEDQKKMVNAAQKVWTDVEKLSPECAKAIEMIKDFLKETGRM